jgi:hypothetical protein
VLVPLIENSAILTADVALLFRGVVVNWEIGILNPL